MKLEAKVADEEANYEKAMATLKQETQVQWKMITTDDGGHSTEKLYWSTKCFFINMFSYLLAKNLGGLY